MRNVFGDMTTDEASEAGRDQEGSWELGAEFALDSETVAGMGYVRYTAQIIYAQWRQHTTTHAHTSRF